MTTVITTNASKLHESVTASAEQLSELDSLKRVLQLGGFCNCLRGIQDECAIMSSVSSGLLGQFSIGNTPDFQYANHHA